MSKKLASFVAACQKNSYIFSMDKRYLYNNLIADLNEKMVFLAGARQTGKTTLARSLPNAEKGYLNWDVPGDRERILKNELPLSDLLILDEFHKYRSWRTYLKGLYDNPALSYNILVTGSAKLDYFRFGGDSLQGRYHFLRLHPLSVAELNLSTENDLMLLLKFGGFPEPFFKGSEVFSRRWTREYRDRLIYDDIRTLDNVTDLGNIELLALRLPELTGSPLSINSIREDLRVSHKTVSKWLDILERMYAIVRIPPFGSQILRAVKKEQKHYHYDWTLVKEPGLRFENMMAMQLLKWVHYKQDLFGLDFDLKYFRDIDGREVDFVITEDNKPIEFIEVKRGDTQVSKGLKYLKKRFPDVKSFQLSATGTKEYRSKENIIVMPALNYLKGLI